MSAAVCVEHDPGRSAAEDDRPCAARVRPGRRSATSPSPPNHAPGAGIPDSTQIHPTLIGAQVRDIRDPHCIKGPGIPLPGHQNRDRCTRASPIGATGRNRRGDPFQTLSARRVEETTVFRSTAVRFQVRRAHTDSNGTYAAPAIQAALTPCILRCLRRSRLRWMYKGSAGTPSSRIKSPGTWRMVRAATYVLKVRTSLDAAVLPASLKLRSRPFTAAGVHAK